MSEPISSCTSKPLHVAAYVVYDLGAAVILGVARVIIALVGYVYYSCCSSGAIQSERVKIEEEKGNTIGAGVAKVKKLYAKAKDKVTAAVDGGMTAEEAKKIFASQIWRGLSEIIVIGAWYHSYRDAIDPESGIFGLGRLEEGFNRFADDLQEA